MVKIQPAIHINFGTPIWKLVIDDECGFLFAELRDAEKHEVSFASVSLTSGKLNFDKVILPERWLTGLEGACKGVMLLHGYQSAQSPAHQGLFAIDGLSGGQFWGNYNLALQHLGVKGPVVYNTQVQPKKLVLIDALSGSTIRNYELAIDTPVDQAIKMPAIIGHVPEEFTSFIKDEPTGNVHYMEHNGYRIVSLHVLHNGFLQQAILICKNGVLLYEGILNEGILKLQPESFIIHQSRLIYIKNTTNLIVINL